MESLEADNIGAKQVRVTLRPLRSEERVRLTVEYGSKVGDLRHLVEQKFGVTPPAKLLRLTKQRTYVSCEDWERIKQDRVLHVKDVEWLQDPSAPTKSIVANNPEAFVDPPRRRRQAALEASEPSATANQLPADHEANANLQSVKEVSHFRVVHTHVWVRSAPNVEAKRLGLLQSGRVVSGKVVDGWLLLDGHSRKSMGETAAEAGPAWALIDGREMGYGVLLEKLDSGRMGQETRSILAQLRGPAVVGAEGRWKAAAALAGLDDVEPEQPLEAPPQRFTAASWLVVPDAGTSVQVAALAPATRAKEEENMALELEAMERQVMPKFGALSEDADARTVLMELLSDERSRKQAREALELLHSYERLREIRATRAAIGGGAAPATPPMGPSRAGVEAGAAEALPPSPWPASSSSSSSSSALRGRQEAAAAPAAPASSAASWLVVPPGAAPDSDASELAETSRGEEREQPLAADPHAQRLAAERARDPLRLFQVFTIGWRYGEWFQDTERFRQRAPFGMLRGAMQEDLLRYLMDRAPFNAVSEEAHVAMRKKYRLAKEKFEGKRDFLKADWHTVRSLPEVADVFVPRHGARGPALRAPNHIMAFAEAFREVNEKAWQALAGRLRSGLAPKGKEELEGLGNFFADALEQNRHFGAVELQHFAGTGFEGKKHIDGTTSALHLAVSLSGRRFLRVSSAPNKNALDCQDEVYEMMPGDVYLSSPAAFQHQVIYPSCDFDNAMVSLHMRFLFEPHWWLKKWVNHLRDNDMREVTAAVAETLLNQRLRLPTLGEVKLCEAKLQHVAFGRS